MFNNEKLGAVFSSNHKWIEAEGRHRASILAANVDKYWAFLVISAVNVVSPKSLFVSCNRLVVEMINFVVKPVFSEVAFIHDW